jgi:nicotinate-nucleotide pyrophosphorylase (carboxylating)
LRLLERYAVELGGGYNGRFGLDDGVIVTSNHISILGSVATAVKSAKEKLGYLHKVAVQIANESELKEAVASGADVIMLDGMSAEEVKRMVEAAKAVSPSVAIECSGEITPANVREYAEAGAQLIRVEALTNAAPAMKISFRVQPF